MSRVLIMDDEIIIRNSAGRVLSRMGHEVQYASHGEEVIALYQVRQHESQRAFDVVILDLIIRDGMGGQEALTHLRRLDPHVKAIVSSGSTTDPAVLEYANQGFRAVLAKPYGKRELAAALQKILEGS
jgi:CheY-like chemotaxis protein